MLSTVVLALAIGVPLAGCGSSSSPAATQSTSGASATTAPPKSTKVAVAISGYAYHPPAVTVAAGTRITFTNHDMTAHTATSKTPSFDSGTLKPGQSQTVTVTKPGTYSYYCQFHPFMVGTVTVK